jgi:hypothetical protein
MSEGKIYPAMAQIMKEVDAIGKNQMNDFQHFRFRGVDSVMNELHPLFVKNGIITVPEVVETMPVEERPSKGGGVNITRRYKVAYHFIADDGSQITTSVIGEGMDSGDKASNKALAIAYKYAMLQTFCIPTEDMGADDPDNYTPRASGPMQQAQSPRKPAPQASQPQHIEPGYVTPANPNNEAVMAARNQLLTQAGDLLKSQNETGAGWFSDDEKKHYHDMAVKATKLDDLKMLLKMINEDLLTRQASQVF